MTEQPRSPFQQIGLIRVPRVTPRWAVMTLVSAIAAFGGGTWARQSTDPPPNYDIRSAKDPGTAGYFARFSAPAAVADLSKRRADGLVRLATAQPAMEMDVNPELGTPEIIGVRPGFGFLTGPSVDRVGTMRGFLSTYADIYGDRKSVV